MELNTIQQQGKWSELSDTLNENFEKIKVGVTRLDFATRKNKGYFKSMADLTNNVPIATFGDIAYVGTNYPYAIYEWNGTQWADTGAPGGENEVNLGNYYTKEEVDVLQENQNIEFEEKIEGVRDENNAAFQDVKQWVKDREVLLSEEEYNALETIDPDKIYYIYEEE